MDATLQDADDAEGSRSEPLAVNASVPWESGTRHRDQFLSPASLLERWLGADGRLHAGRCPGAVTVNRRGSGEALPLSLLLSRVGRRFSMLFSL